ncbi:MAG: hypothetical protein QXL16_00415 [Candidatus Micrarchaeaceae archaeon]
MLKPSILIRVEKIKRYMQLLAYVSLVIDIMISITSFVEIKFYNSEITKFLIYLDYSVTAEVIIAGILFLAFVFFVHYDKIELRILRLMRYERRRKNKKGYR